MIAVKMAEKRYCSRAMALAIVAALILLAAGVSSVARGLVLGTLFSIINFVIMSRHLAWQIRADRRRAAGASFLGLMIRLVVLAVPLAVAAQAADFDFYATATGLFMVQLQIITEQFWQLRTTKNGR